MMAFDIEETHEDFSRLRLRLLELYTQHIAVFTQIFPGIAELLVRLNERGIDWGIATNKPWIYTEPLMAALNIQPPAKTIICPEHVKLSKPDPESLFLASKQIGCQPEEIIYVGDHLRDIECGKRAGCITIAAGYGYIENQNDIELWNADYKVNHAQELWPIIERHL
jgi:phosphoglycolate phosphatase